MSLNETKARASVPSDLRYRARFSGRLGVGCSAAGWCILSLDAFLGEDEKKLSMPPLVGAGGVGATATAGGWVRALNCAMM
jgi:hypothetical protein